MSSATQKIVDKTAHSGQNRHAVPERANISNVSNVRRRADFVKGEVTK